MLTASHLPTLTVLILHTFTLSHFHTLHILCNFVLCIILQLACFEFCKIFYRVYFCTLHNYAPCMIYTLCNVYFRKVYPATHFQSGFIRMPLSANSCQTKNLSTPNYSFQIPPLKREPEYEEKI